MRGTTLLKKADGAGKSEEDRTLEGRRRQTVAVFALRIGKEGFFIIISRTTCVQDAGRKGSRIGMSGRGCVHRLAGVSIAARICISVLENFQIFCPLCFSFVSLGLCLCGVRAVLSTHLGAGTQGQGGSPPS